MKASARESKNNNGQLEDTVPKKKATKQDKADNKRHAESPIDERMKHGSASLQ